LLERSGFALCLELWQEMAGFLIFLAHADAL
jgi:hypothetical protein